MSLSLKGKWIAFSHTVGSQVPGREMTGPSQLREWHPSAPLGITKTKNSLQGEWRTLRAWPNEVEGKNFIMGSIATKAGGQLEGLSL